MSAPIFLLDRRQFSCRRLLTVLHTYCGRKDDRSEGRVFHISYSLCLCSLFFVFVLLVAVLVHNIRVFDGRGMCVEYPDCLLMASPQSQFWLLQMYWRFCKTGFHLSEVGDQVPPRHPVSRSAVISLISLWWMDGS